MVNLAEEVLKGNRRAAAKLITQVENGNPEAVAALAKIYPHTGSAHIIGVTGPPGSGKSTLVKQLVKEFRARNKQVGVVAVDPTSPFTGGALLGDRIRMQELSGDPGVFIRSMASRGNLGGLARGTADAVRVLDALGCEIIIIETVGAGQSEVDIARNAHTVLVVEVPGMGDEIQVIKAGILEIADVFVVNKADRDGADHVVAELETMLLMAPDCRNWTPPVLKAISTTAEGVKEVADKIEDHARFLAESGELQKRNEENLRRELLKILKAEFADELVRLVARERIEQIVNRVIQRQIDPTSGARELLREFQEAIRCAGGN